MDPVVSFKYDEDNLLFPSHNFREIAWSITSRSIKSDDSVRAGPLCLFSPFYVRRLLMKKLKITLAQIEHTALKCGCWSTKCGDANIVEAI